MTEASAPTETVDNAATAQNAGAETQQTSAAETTTQTSTPPASVPEFSFKDWREKNEELKGVPSLQKFDTVEGLAKSYVNLEKMMGGDKVPLPKPGDKEGWDRWYKAAGRPDNAEGYGFAKPETIPEGMEYSEDLDKSFAAKAHELGLSKAQAAALRDWQFELLTKGYTDTKSQSDAARETATAQLRAEYGRTFDQKLSSAKAAVKEYGGDEFLAFLDQSGLGDHPAMVKAFAKIAEKTMGDNQLVGDKRPVDQTPADLDKAIADFRRQHWDALSDSSHVEHAQRQREFTALYQKRFPS